MLMTFLAGLFGRQFSHRFLPAPDANLESTVAGMQDSRIKNAAPDIGRRRCSMSATSRRVRRRQARTAKTKMCDGGHFAPPSPAV